MYLRARGSAQSVTHGERRDSRRTQTPFVACQSPLMLRQTVVVAVKCGVPRFGITVSVSVANTDATCFVTYPCNMFCVDLTMSRVLFTGASRHLGTFTDATMLPRFMTKPRQISWQKAVLNFPAAVTVKRAIDMLPAAAKRQRVNPITLVQVPALMISSQTVVVVNMAILRVQMSAVPFFAPAPGKP